MQARFCPKISDTKDFFSLKVIDCVTLDPSENCSNQKLAI